MNASVGALKPNIVTTQLEANAVIEAANKYVSATIAMAVLEPYELEALMHFSVSLSLNGLSAKVYTLIDTIISLNFVSKDFFMANGFYKDCETAPKLAIRVAS